MNSHYSMIIFWSQEDNCYVVHLPDFPFQDIHTHGNTYEEAAKHGQQVIDSYLLKRDITNTDSLAAEFVAFDNCR